MSDETDDLRIGMSSQEATCPIVMISPHLTCGRPLHPAPKGVDDRPVCLMHSNDSRKGDGMLLSDFWNEFDQTLAEGGEDEAHFQYFVFPPLSLPKRTFLPKCNFTFAVFNGEANFFNTTFMKSASFGSVRFSGKANFTFTKFESQAYFSGAISLATQISPVTSPGLRLSTAQSSIRKPASVLFSRKESISLPPTSFRTQLS